jgi:hypothetical protein
MNKSLDELIAERNKLSQQLWELRRDVKLATLSERRKIIKKIRDNTKKLEALNEVISRLEEKKNKEEVKKHLIQIRDRLRATLKPNVFGIETELSSLAINENLEVQGKLPCDHEFKESLLTLYSLPMLWDLANFEGIILQKTVACRKKHKPTRTGDVTRAYILEIKR